MNFFVKVNKSADLVFMKAERSSSEFQFKASTDSKMITIKANSLDFRIFCGDLRNEVDFDVVDAEDYIV